MPILFRNCWRSCWTTSLQSWRAASTLCSFWSATDAQICNRTYRPVPSIRARIKTWGMHTRSVSGQVKGNFEPDSARRARLKRDMKGPYAARPSTPSSMISSVSLKGFGNTAGPSRIGAASTRSSSCGPYCEAKAADSSPSSLRATSSTLRHTETAVPILCGL